jgi:hypothetical protein
VSIKPPGILDSSSYQKGTRLICRCWCCCWCSTVLQEVIWCSVICKCVAIWCRSSSSSNESCGVVRCDGCKKELRRNSFFFPFHFFSFFFFFFSREYKLTESNNK